MPISTFRVKSVSEKPERRQNRHTKVWFSVWTIEREPDDNLPIGEALAGYETSNPWHATLCDRARLKGLPITVLWKESPYMRVIVEVTLAHQESAA